jgi:hypothetical protein
MQSRRFGDSSAQARAVVLMLAEDVPLRPFYVSAVA